MNAAGGTTFILIHGGWHGGWAYSDVIAHLTQRGHRALAPSLTGLADRQHLVGSAVNLETHILDIANLLEWEQFTDVVLCGHSYGGMVVSGVADRLPDRIRARVYLDAYVPDDGDSCWTLAGDRYRKVFLAGLTASGLACAPPQRPGTDARRTPHPFASLVQSIRITGRIEQVTHKGFLFALRHEDSPFRSLYERCLADPKWRTTALDCGHNVLAAEPKAVADFLLEFA